MNLTLFRNRPQWPEPGAEFSVCGRYRYLLRWPTSVDNDRICLWVLANPSTATAESLDPTLRRCVGFAASFGYGWMWVVNVRAWRETDPRKLPSDPEAVGPQNDAWIAAAAESADLVVCGWGRLGGHRGVVVGDALRCAGIETTALRTTSDGSPTHPLYLPRSCVPLAYGVQVAE